MAGRRFDVADVVQVLRLWDAGMSNREIARRPVWDATEWRRQPVCTFSEERWALACHLGPYFGGTWRWDKRVSPASDLNRKPLVYKTNALPIELAGHPLEAFTKQPLYH